MAIIRPCADLRNKYNEISRICHETKKPVYITKNGHNDLVMLSNEAYELLAEGRVEKQLEKDFNEKYPNFESFRKDVFEKIEISCKEIEDGKGIPMGKALAEMEDTYGIQE